MTLTQHNELNLNDDYYSWLKDLEVKKDGGLEIDERGRFHGRDTWEAYRELTFTIIFQAAEDFILFHPTSPFNKDKTSREHNIDRFLFRQAKEYIFGNGIGSAEKFLEGTDLRN